jgi:hypothetical protein
VLVGGDGGVGGGGVAGEVFFVPEIEVGAVVGHGEIAEVRIVGKAIAVGGLSLVVPVCSGLVVKLCDCGEIGHTGLGIFHRGKEAL